jgi:Ribosome biogenesis protein Nop16
MVKHGRNKKRRAGRIGKTKLKNKNFLRWDPNPKIGDETVQRLWDTTKTPRQNLALMGLVTDVNGDAAAAFTHSNNNAPVDSAAIDLFPVPDSDTRTKQDRLPMTEEDQEYIVKCMAKYGTDNYNAMFRDIRINSHQHTREKLEKMAARFLLLNPNQLLIPAETVPDSIRKQMHHRDDILK